MNKKILSLLIIDFFLLVIMCTFFILARSLQGSLSTSPSPTTQQSLTVNNILPNAKVTVPYLPIQFITFTFNLPIDPSQFKYTVSPQVATEPKNGATPNVIILSPTSNWQEGQTIITVTQDTTALNGTHLQSPVVYTINAAFPTGGE